MHNFIIWLLTSIAILAILSIRPKRNEQPDIKFSQTIVYEFMKAMILSGALEPKVSQSRNHSKSKSIKFVRTNEDKIYWLEDTTVYVTDIQDGSFDLNAGKPVEVQHLSKEELDKLLSILDALQNG
jgi:hypothetical protein